MYVTKVEQKCSFISYYVFYCCVTGGNIVLMSFLSSLIDSQTATQALKLGEIYGFALHFPYSWRASTGMLRASVNIRFWTIELRLHEKPSLTSLIKTHSGQLQRRQSRLQHCGVHRNADTLMAEWPNSKARRAGTVWVLWEGMFPFPPARGSGQHCKLPTAQSPGDMLI